MKVIDKFIFKKEGCSCSFVGDSLFCIQYYILNKGETKWTKLYPIISFLIELTVDFASII